LMVIGVGELTRVSRNLVAQELKPMEIYLLAALFYLIMTSSVSWLTKQWEKRYVYSG